ncbi:Gfa-like protein [Photobacterium aphoticum]|uniref:Gfa-like protein n=1 Tax=Photobacterium aphoticum TaxID=754436 RepID=A0A090QNS5_9GAMM|nr:Gfa-like protein [Photobacterium aphoticum]
MCRKRGAIAASVLLENLKVVKGEDNLTLYQFNTMTAKHYFCKTCGIYTHHQRRSNPHQFAINVACLEGVNPYELEPVRITDGINHPSDAS